MSPFRNLLHAVQSWLRRHGGPKTPKRAVATVEQLDHRQLLAVNFTGIVTTDFPETTSPGVVVLRADAGDQIATPDVDLAPLIQTSGFAISAIRLTYDPTDDSLSFGLEQPLSGRGTGLPVIAGDADDNLNEAAVDPAVLAVTPTFRDPADLDGTETMTIFMDLNGDLVPDIVAGKPQISLDVPKLYHVALAQNTPSSSRPDYGPILPNNTGNVYLVNDPRHPGFEFEITSFSQLYSAFNPGLALTPETVLSVGAYAGSLQDGSVSETFINFKSFTFGDSILPPPECPDCPPVSPPILVNPHEYRHINTAHRSLVRVYVYGSSGFNVDNIVNETVTLGGATPAFAYNRRINADPFQDRVFVFHGNEINLPPGFTLATVGGELVDGTPFSSQIAVFNRDASFYPGSQMMIGNRPLRSGYDPGSVIVATSRAPRIRSDILVNPSVDTTVAGRLSTPISRNAAAALASTRWEQVQNALPASGGTPVVRIPMSSRLPTTPIVSPAVEQPATVRIAGLRTDPSSSPLKIVIPGHLSPESLAR